MVKGVHDMGLSGNKSQMILTHFRCFFLIPLHHFN